ncbi:MAG: hypothetical protein R3C45_22255 [Phycisphaerales bacterium]
MRLDYTRGPARFFLIHHALARFRGRGWFSAHQAARATFFGVGRVHQQRLKRVREMLEKYVEAGILERNDRIAACPLYRHRDVTLDQVDPLLADSFELHASRFRMTSSHSFNLKLLDHYLDQVAPQNPALDLFDKHGRLMIRELQDYVERMKQPKPVARVLGYLNEPT